MNSMERDFDVTIIPKLICLLSQVLWASSVQSEERQRITAEKKEILNNLLSLIGRLIGAYLKATL